MSSWQERARRKAQSRAAKTGRVPDRVVVEDLREDAHCGDCGAPYCPTCGAHTEHDDDHWYVCPEGCWEGLRLP